MNQVLLAVIVLTVVSQAKTSDVDETLRSACQDLCQPLQGQPRQGQPLHGRPKSCSGVDTSNGTCHIRYSNQTYEWCSSQCDTMMSCGGFTMPNSPTEDRATCVHHIRPPGVHSRNHWYVSAVGRDSSSCGSHSHPCRDLSRVISRALAYDVIFIDGNISDEASAYTLPCDSTGTVHLLASVWFIGYPGHPRLTCKKEAKDAQTTQLNSTRGGLNFIAMKNLIIENTVLTVSNCTIIFTGVTLRNSSVMTIGACSHLKVDIHNSKWFGDIFCDSQGLCSDPQYTRTLSCNHTDLTISHSTLLQTQIRVESRKTNNIFVTDSLFSNDLLKTSYLGGLHVSHFAFGSVILVKDSIFENQFHPKLTNNVLNLYEAAISIKSNAVNRLNETSNSMVSISNCTFRYNERAVVFIGPFEQIEMLNNTFDGNVAAHAGPSVLVLTTKETPLLIKKCLFSNNTAGKLRNHSSMIESNNAVKVDGGEVHLNSECCKGTVSLVGKGGAIRVQRGRVQITSSTFINNVASQLGGAIYVDQDATLTIHTSRFENSHKLDDQSDILYSGGVLNIHDVQFIVHSAKSGTQIFSHNGDHWSLDLTNTWFQCPVGYNIRSTNSSAYGVSPYGLRRSHKLDQLSLSCEYCPRTQYSLDYGYFNYTAVFKTFAYFSLLINGSVPKREWSGSIELHTIQCQDCPSGGRCEQGIHNEPNFWGFASESSIIFQHCPYSYCNSDQEHALFNECAANRTGKLCGRCAEGYTEMLFTSECVPNESCNSHWSLCIVVVSVLYTIFLLFRVNITKIICSSSLFCSRPTKWFYGTDKSKQNIKVCASDKQQKDQLLGINDKHVTSTEPCGDRGNKLHETNCSFLIIVFFYFQDAFLLHVHTEQATDSWCLIVLQSIASGIFRFQVSFIGLAGQVCIAPGLTPVTKSLLNPIIIPCILFLFGLVYVVYKIVYRGQGGNIVSAINRGKFVCCLSSGFMLALLLMYQQFGLTLLNLLHCVPLENETVLFMDGEISCFQPWQYAVMIYAIICVIPFFLVLIVGVKLLKQGRIPLTHFFIGCLLPLPFLLYWLVIICRSWNKSLDTDKGPSEGSQTVLQIVDGPFRMNKHASYWIGIHMGYRLILMLLFVFIEDGFIRLMWMGLVYFVLLNHHVHVQPYQNRYRNIAATISAAALVVVSVINSLRTGITVVQSFDNRHHVQLIQILTHIEHVLVIWLPLAIVGLVVLVFVVRLIAFAFSCISCSKGDVLSLDMSRNKTECTGDEESHGDHV